MAVVMETVAWRGSGASKSTSPKSNTWGADAQKLMHMMMGQLQSSEPQQLSTLDLFHQADHPLELSEPELPLPSGWEKCLDLQSGKLYYVQRSSGVSTFEDPRKLSEPHEFLGSKRSEEEANCRPSSSGSETTQTPLKWTFDREEEEEQHVELDLNLATSTSRRSVVNQTVCTVEMIQNALRRTSENAATKSSSLSSLTSVDHPVDAPETPSTSSSSSTSSKSRSRPSSSSKVCEDGGALVMGACTRCLMYVMLKKMDPRCPRCESEVPVDFSTGPPSCKRQRR